MPNPSKEKRFDGFSNRTKWFSTTLICASVVIILRLAFLQLMQGDIYANQADSQRIYPIQLKAQRGPIFGRDRSIVLASNRAACDLILVPKECEGQEEAVCRRLESLIGINASNLIAEVKRNERKKFTQIPVKRDISRRELTRVEEMAFALPGVFTVVSSQRRYLYKETAGQIMGWINEIGKDELDRMPGYSRGDVIGRDGLEKSYENSLKGKDGQMWVSRYNMGTPMLRTDSYGNPLMTPDQHGRKVTWDQVGREVTLEYRDDPTPGRPIFVTLDMDLQAKAEEVLRNAVQAGAENEAVRGAIVVLNANTGEILAMASLPGYDPNVFVDAAGSVRDSEGLSPRERLLSHDSLKRMRNRAYQERYPPGSIFKVMMAVAALEEGVINEHTTFFCPGHFSLGNTRWACWSKGGHGTIAVENALAFSCDVFFYNVGLKLGIERIKKWSSLLGLGELTGVDLPREDTGLVPSPEWKAAFYPNLNEWDRAWQPGETVNLAIGQGHCAITPLQAAVMVAAIVNGGHIVRPYLNAGENPVVSEQIISDKTLDIVRRGMLKCVNKKDPPSGTGKLAYIEGLDIIGKTGTAQVVSKSAYENLKEEKIPYALRDHAWFVAGVLNQDPPIAIAVLFEHGLHGSAGATPLAHDVIEYFYQQRAAADSMRVAQRSETP